MSTVRGPELDRAVELMASFPGAWYVAGGWALDMSVGIITREHDNVDIAGSADTV